MSEWKPLHTMNGCKEPFFAYIPDIKACHLVKWNYMGNLWDFEDAQLRNPKSVTLVLPKPEPPTEVTE